MPFHGISARCLKEVTIFGHYAWSDRPLVPMNESPAALPRSVIVTVVAVASLLVAAAVWLFVNRAGIAWA